MSSELLPVWGATGTAVAPDSTKLSVGWTLGEKPPYEYMNWWQGIVTDRVNDILRNGPAPWAAGTLYQIGALVSRNGLIFRALAVNTNSAPPSANWLQITQNADALTSGTVAAARLPGTMNPTSFSGGAPQLTVNRPDATTNAVARYTTTAGSVFAGQGAPGVFSVGAVADQNTAGNRRFQVDTANGNVTWSGSASGNGSGLTNLNAANLASGTLPNARLVGDYSFANLALSGSLTLDGGNVSGANRVIVQPGGGGGTPSYGFVGVAGAGMHMYAGALTLDFMFGSSARLSVNATEVAAVNGAAFTGPGTGLTNVPATGLTGTLPNARLVGDYSFANLTLSGGLSASTVAAGSRFSVSAGSAADVGYGFAGYQDLGLYRAGEQVRVSVMGSATAAFTSNGIVALAGKTFSGDGSDLTNLNAGALASGTIPDARIPAAMNAREFIGPVGVTLNRTTNSVNSGIEFKTTAGSVFAGQGSSGIFTVGNNSNLAGGGNSTFRVDVNAGGIDWSGAASGNGSGITNLNAGNLATGILPNARLSGAYSFASLALTGNLTAGYVYAPTVESAAGSAANPGHSFVGVTGIGMYRSGSLLYLAQDGTAAIGISSASINAGGGRIWGGNGSNLTDLEASNITTGTLNTARLSTGAAAVTWVGERTAALSAGAIGSYVMGWLSGGITYNSTYAGSGINPGGVVQSSGAADLRRDSGTTLSGTWRALGNTHDGSNGHLTLFRRIS